MLATSSMSAIGKSTNIFWQECQVGKVDREKLLKQKGCVVWITGLSGSGKSTLACTLGRELHSKGKLTYVLDGDNLRHGLNKDLGFSSEDRAENIRRVGEVAKLFSDAGLICIASLISPYRKDRDSCRAIVPDSRFIEVFMNMPLELCEARDAKGLYKLARAGKIKGFTGIDDPYEPPLNCEAKALESEKKKQRREIKKLKLLVAKGQAAVTTDVSNAKEKLETCQKQLNLQEAELATTREEAKLNKIEIKQENGICPSSFSMAGQVVGYLEEKGLLQE
ncbi:hypothetical protein ZIOFF_008045 [Zingiber officinale]|uniref:Adenylyl-sulfate kinase n=1 Tax=Zingiber officinale TaxID=94328 RepID=A0A8J5LQJ0_ZINOF|nr:hypothetical protein ZIOFF_008045 [Zingiber officinale]